MTPEAIFASRRRRRKLYRQKLFEEMDGRCWFCGTDVPFYWDGTIDHMRPRSRGGRTTLNNLVFACSPCNHEKDNRTVDEYRTIKRVLMFHGEKYPRRILDHEE